MRQRSFSPAVIRLEARLPLDGTMSAIAPGAILPPPVFASTGYVAATPISYSYDQLQLADGPIGW